MPVLLFIYSVYHHISELWQRSVGNQLLLLSVPLAFEMSSLTDEDGNKQRNEIKVKKENSKKLQSGWSQTLWFSFQLQYARASDTNTIGTNRSGIWSAIHSVNLILSSPFPFAHSPHQTFQIPPHAFSSLSLSSCHWICQSSPPPHIIVLSPCRHLFPNQIVTWMWHPVTVSSCHITLFLHNFCFLHLSRAKCFAAGRKYCTWDADQVKCVLVLPLPLPFPPSLSSYFTPGCFLLISPYSQHSAAVQSLI